MGGFEKAYFRYLVLLVNKMRLSITFREKPEVLEEIIGYLPAFKRVAESEWEWKSSLGNITLIFYEDDNSMDIFVSNNSYFTCKRVNKFAQRIKEHYKDCQVDYIR